MEKEPYSREAYDKTLKEATEAKTNKEKAGAYGKLSELEEMAYDEAHKINIAKKASIFNRAWRSAYLNPDSETDDDIDLVSGPVIKKIMESRPGLIAEMEKFMDPSLNGQEFFEMINNLSHRFGYHERIKEEERPIKHSNFYFNLPSGGKIDVEVLLDKENALRFGGSPPEDKKSDTLEKESKNSLIELNGKKEISGIKRGDHIILKKISQKGSSAVSVGATISGTFMGDKIAVGERIVVDTGGSTSEIIDLAGNEGKYVVRTASGAEYTLIKE